MLVLLCYENDFMMSLTDDTCTQADIIKAFNSNSKYLDYTFEYQQSILRRNSYSNLS